MKVTLLAHTENPERIVAAAARLCYSDTEVGGLLEGMTGEKAAGLIDMLLGDLGHESPIEHANFTFAIEGVSRSLLAQITRHRHASFSVQSQRYVRLDAFRYVIPPAIAEDEEAAGIFRRAMDRNAKDYERIAGVLKEKYRRQSEEDGTPAVRAAAAAEKRAIEDARFVFPNACETKMIVTMNARSLCNFFRQRCCRRAQWEIRALAKEMLKLVYPVAPAIFRQGGPACLKGSCPEGKMSCQGMEAVREEYRMMKEEARGG